MELSKRAFRWLVDRALLDLRSGSLQGDVVSLDAAASADLQNGVLLLSVFNRTKGQSHHLTNAHPHPHARPGPAMSDVPSAASGRAAAATNWQSIFTVAAAIGAKLDADMRALALGGDPQVLRLFVDDVLAAIEKSKKGAPVVSAPSSVSSKPASSHFPPPPSHSRATSSSSSVAPSSFPVEAVQSVISIIVPCIAPHFAVQEDELLDFISGSPTSPASFAAAAHAVGMALMAARPIAGVPCSCESMSSSKVVKALQAIFGRCGHLAPVLARDRTGSCLRIMLHLLAPSVTSDVVDTALWACRILARAGFDAAAEGGGGAVPGSGNNDVCYSSFIQPLSPPSLSGLHACLVCFIRHTDCAKAAAAVIEQFVRGQLGDCLLVQIPLVFATSSLLPSLAVSPCHLMQIVLVHLSTLPTLRAELIRDSCIASLHTFACARVQDGVDDTDAAAALRLEVELWSVFASDMHTLGAAAGECVSVFHSFLAKDGVALSLRQQALETFFLLLKHVISVRSPIAPTVYKGFIALMPVLWVNQELQRLLCDGLAGVLRANPRMPSLPLLEPLISILTGVSGSDTQLLCWELIHAIVHHPRIESDARQTLRDCLCSMVVPFVSVAPLCKVLQDAAVAWGAAHKPSIDSALDRLKKGAKDHPQKDGSSKIPAPSSAPLVRRSSEPDVATAFAAASGASAGNDHSLLKNKPVKPQPPPGSKAQGNPKEHIRAAAPAPRRPPAHVDDHDASSAAKDSASPTQASPPLRKRSPGISVQQQQHDQRPRASSTSPTARRPAVPPATRPHPPPVPSRRSAPRSLSHNDNRNQFEGSRHERALEQGASAAPSPLMHRHVFVKLPEHELLERREAEIRAKAEAHERRMREKEERALQEQQRQLQQQQAVRRAVAKRFNEIRMQKDTSSCASAVSGSSSPSIFPQSSRASISSMCDIPAVAAPTRRFDVERHRSLWEGRPLRRRTVEIVVALLDHVFSRAFPLAPQHKGPTRSYRALASPAASESRAPSTLEAVRRALAQADNRSISVEELDSCGRGRESYTRSLQSCGRNATRASRRTRRRKRGRVLWLQKQSDYERLAQRRKAVKEKLEQYRREKEQELAQKQALQQADEQKRGAQRRAEVLKFLQQRRENPRRNSVILPALADVHVAAAAQPRRAGGGGKRARLAGAPVLASIMEGVPVLAEEDDSANSSAQQQQQTYAADASPALPPPARKVLVGPDGSQETWDVQAAGQ